MKIKLVGFTVDKIDFHNCGTQNCMGSIFHFKLVIQLTEY